MGNPPKTVVSCSTISNKKALPSPESRLKREDHSLSDDLFSDWKLLVGHNGWQEKKYRVHKLPLGDFMPGVYELALHLNISTHGHSTREHGSDMKSEQRDEERDEEERDEEQDRHTREDTMAVVYVGQSGNVRQRLQQYGSPGSHLEHGSDWTKNWQYMTTNTKVLETKPGGLDMNVHPLNTLEEDSSGRPRLFTAAFCRGYSIAFRWTKTKSKDDAIAVETGLLRVFDYAWNKDRNGERRPDDALRKMQQQLACSDGSSKARILYQLPKILVSKVRNLREKRTLQA